MKKIAEIIREQREQKGLLLREVAAKIEIDQALLSKIERGERMPTKEQVIRFAKFYKIDQGDLLIAFLSDRLVYELLDEEMALKAMHENLLGRFRWNRLPTGVPSSQYF